MFGFNFRKKAQGDRGEPMPVEHSGAPDSTNPSGLCPRCRKQSSFQSLGSIPLTFSEGYKVLPSGVHEPIFHERATVLVCRHCEQGISVLEEELTGGRSKRSGERHSGVISWQGFHWWPLAGSSAHSAVPSEIASALNEAVLCLSANCPRAAAVMARRTLEAIATDKGGGKSKDALAKQLANMAASGLLQPTLADWAKEVRAIGNSGAHFDPIDTVSNADASQLIEFLQALIEYLYVLPYDLAQRRAARP